MTVQSQKCQIVVAAYSDIEKKVVIFQLKMCLLKCSTNNNELIMPVLLTFGKILIGVVENGIWYLKYKLE